MGREIPLGRFAGVKVGMSPAVPLIAAVYVWVLADRSFPTLEPGLGQNWYWAAGAGGALLFFVSLMVHEIGHALVAQDEGIGVRSMSLTPLGGVTRMESSPTTAGAELRVSVVGPIASACCGIVLLVGAYLMPAGGLAGLGGHVLGWAGFVNLALALFNLIPASPLDGGRVLSALIWLRTRDRARAVTYASWAGIVAGLVMIYAGYRNWHPGGIEDSGFRIGLYAVGGFIVWSASQELRSAPLLGALDGLKVSHAMHPTPPTAPGWLPLREFLRTTTPSEEHRAYPVIDSTGMVTGLLTVATIRSVPPDRWADLTVAELAFPLDRLVVAAHDEDLLSAIQKLQGSDVGDGIVVGPDGTVVGTIDDSSMHRGIAARRTGQPAPTG